VTGGPVPILEGVRRAIASNSGGASAYFGFSGNGALVYIPDRPLGNTELLTVAMVDRTGARKPLDIPAGGHATPRISPNGKQLALVTDDLKESVVWIYDLGRAVPGRRLTFGGRNLRPIWSKDGQNVAFSSERAGWSAYWQPADGSGSAQPLFRPERGMFRLQSESWSPDGKTLIFVANPGDATSSIWMTSPSAVQKPQQLVAAPSTHPNLSLDGRWLAYASGESGRLEVYVQPFPLTGAKYQVSTAGGDRPLWSPDGKQLFYVSTGAVRQILAVDVQTQPNFVIGKTTPLPIQGLVETGPRNYDITPDGKYFVALFPQSQPSSDKPPPEQIYITLNWFEDLKQRVPVR
jgi:Tol biopolymer transport system component